MPSSHCLGFTTRPRLLVRPDGSSRSAALGPVPSLTLMLDMMCTLKPAELGSRPLPAGPLVACMGNLACSRAASAGGGPLEHNWALLCPCPGRLMTAKDQSGLGRDSGGYRAAGGTKFMQSKGFNWSLPEGSLGKGRVQLDLTPELLRASRDLSFGWYNNQAGSCQGCRAEMFFVLMFPSLCPAPVQGGSTEQLAS